MPSDRKKPAPARKPKDASAASNVRAVSKALDILTYVAGATQGVGVRELGRRIDLGKSATSRIVLTLEHDQFLRKDTATGRYLLGPALLKIAADHRSSIGIRQVAQPHMQRLVTSIGETAFLGVLDGLDVVIVDRVETSSPLRMVSDLGAREPAYCTGLGKVLMAGLADEARERILAKAVFHPYTVNTCRTSAEFRRGLAKVEKEGLAFDNEEFYDGVRCMAAPIRDHSGQTVAAVSIAGPVIRFSNRRLDEFRQSIRAAAAAISHDLGYAPRAVASGGMRSVR